MDIFEAAIVFGFGFVAYLYYTGNLFSFLKNLTTNVVSEADDVEIGIADDVMEGIFGEDIYENKIKCNKAWIAFENTLNIFNWVFIPHKKIRKVKQKILYCRYKWFRSFFLNDLANGDQSKLFTDTKHNVIYHVPSGDYKKSEADQYSKFKIINEGDMDFFFYLNYKDLQIAKDKYSYKFRKINYLEEEAYHKPHQAGGVINIHHGGDGTGEHVINDGHKGFKPHINHHHYSGGYLNNN